MVRRALILFLSLCICLSFSASATVYFTPSQSLYGESSVISSSFLSLFDRLSLSVGIKDYVLYRSGQYEYTLVYGDLVWDGVSFSGSDVSFCSVQTYNGYSGDYLWSSGDLSSFSLLVSGRLVYSSLGGFPQLDFNGYYVFLFFSIVLLAYVFIRLCLNIFSAAGRR